MKLNMVEIHHWKQQSNSIDLNSPFVGGGGGARAEINRIWIANKVKDWPFSSGVPWFKAHSDDPCR